MRCHLQEAARQAKSDACEMFLPSYTFTFSISLFASSLIISIPARITSRQLCFLFHAVTAAKRIVVDHSAPAKVEPYNRFFERRFVTALHRAFRQFVTSAEVFFGDTTTNAKSAEALSPPSRHLHATKHLGVCYH